MRVRLCCVIRVRATTNNGFRSAKPGFVASAREGRSLTVQGRERDPGVCGETKVGLPCVLGSGKENGEGQRQGCGGCLALEGLWRWTVRCVSGGTLPSPARLRAPSSRSRGLRIASGTVLTQTVPRLAQSRPDRKRNFESESRYKSSDGKLYPTLTRDGKPVPHGKWGARKTNR